MRNGWIRDAVSVALLSLCTFLRIKQYGQFFWKLFTWNRSKILNQESGEDHEVLHVLP